MDSQSIADAVARATPNIAELLDRHAKWSAQMCRNVPSPHGKTFQNVPSDGAPEVAQTAEKFRSVPESSRMFRRVESDETNPPVYTPRERPLTYRQHACARLLVQGYKTIEIAQHLRVEHHTIARWKRKPAFKIELERLRALLTAFAVTRNDSAATSPPPRPAPAPARMTRAQIEQEDRECEAMIEQILRTGGPLKGR